ncbi:MAG: hypothetical protein WC356_00025 [Candidatus Micrarchaeia archaeon]|jgi:hypothetical protein
MKGICLICEKEKEGSKIKEGHVIKIIRKIKTFFGISRGNTLVICSSCLEEYTKRRNGFEKTMLIWTVIGIILALLLIVPSILVGGDIFYILRSIGLSILLIIVLLALVGIVRYIPKLEEDSPKKKTIIKKNLKNKKKKKR